MTEPTYTREHLRRATLAKRDKDLSARVIFDGMRPSEVAKIYGVTTSRVCAAVRYARFKLECLVERDKKMGLN